MVSVAFFHLLYSSPLEFLLGSFPHDFYLFVELLIMFLYCFSDFIELFFVFSCSSLSSLKQLFWILYQVHHRSPCLGSVTGKLLCSFCGVTFPWFFMFLEVFLVLQVFTFEVTVTSSSLFWFTPLNCPVLDFFGSSAMLESLCWTPGLPQRLFHLWVIVYLILAKKPRSDWVIV